MTLLKKLINRIRAKLNFEPYAIVQFEEIKLNQGLILTKLNKVSSSKNLKDYEFKVFSQWGEDGIIQHLINVIEIKNKTFIEFGVEDFSESNCRFLMMKDDWQGFVIDGSKRNIEKLKKSYYFWKHDLKAIDAFIDRENINDLLSKSAFDGDLGILSIDVDGNDYYIFEAIKNFQPRIIICEFNSLFGASRKISVPYDPHFVRSSAHFSNLYAGASLGAISCLAEKKGYALVGTNSSSNNAFFVRKDLLNNRLGALTPQIAFSASNFREARNKNADLSWLTYDERVNLLKGMPVFNIENYSCEIF
jgi:hypothetical protein